MACKCLICCACLTLVAAGAAQSVARRRILQEVSGGGIPSHRTCDKSRHAPPGPPTGSPPCLHAIRLTHSNHLPKSIAPLLPTAGGGGGPIIVAPTDALHRALLLSCPQPAQVQGSGSDCSNPNGRLAAASGQECCFPLVYHGIAFDDCVAVAGNELCRLVGGREPAPLPWPFDQL